MHSVVLMLALIGVDVDCREEFPKRCTAGLQAGQEAPFTGVLLTGDLAAHLFLVEKNLDKRVQLAVKHATARKGVDIQYEKDLRKIDQAAFDEKLRVLQEAQPAWYEHPLFVAPIAIAATLGVILVSVEVMEARK
jgi:hypothetical protein